MSGSKLRRVLVAAVFVPLAFVLSSCDLNLEMNVNADGTGTAMFEFVDTDQELQNFVGATSCAELIEGMGIDAQKDNVKVEDLSKDGVVHCKASSSGPEDLKGDFGKFTDNGDTVTVTLSEGADADKIEQMDMFFSSSKVNLVVNMPGPITEATGSGTVSGNTYKIENGKFSDLSQEIKITSKKSDGFVDSVLSDRTVRRVLIGVVAGVLAAAIGFLVTRRKRSAPVVQPNGPVQPGGGTAQVTPMPPVQSQPQSQQPEVTADPMVQLQQPDVHPQQSQRPLSEPYPTPTEAATESQPNGVDTGDAVVHPETDGEGESTPPRV